MANTQGDGGSNSAVVAIFAIVVIVLVLGFVFLVHPFGVFSTTTVVSPTGSGTTQTTASPSVKASASP
jgi:predicted metalloprotease